jgi:hypothetical protein
MNTPTEHEKAQFSLKLLNAFFQQPLVIATNGNPVVERVVVVPTQQMLAANAEPVIARTIESLSQSIDEGRIRLLQRADPFTARWYASLPWENENRQTVFKAVCVREVLAPQKPIVTLH